LATYKTHQKQDLINFLRNHADQSFTIDEIVEKMKAESGDANTPGKSTIYRLMPRLMEENIVKCFTRGRGYKSTYQIIGGEHCHHHMHMKCTGCGRLIHMSDAESDKILSQIRMLNHFNVDLSQSLLFGRCEGCTQIPEGGNI